MMEEEGHKIAHHLSIKIERKRMSKKLYTERPKNCMYKEKKDVCKKKKMYVKRKKIVPG